MFWPSNIKQGLVETQLLRTVALILWMWHTLFQSPWPFWPCPGTDRVNWLTRASKGSIRLSARFQIHMMYKIVYHLFHKLGTALRLSHTKLHLSQEWPMQLDFIWIGCAHNPIRFCNIVSVVIHDISKNTHTYSQYQNTFSQSTLYL